MSSTDIVRVPVAIPPSLREAGVQVIEQDGVRMITGLDKMKDTHNVLQPISEIAQADPDWSPRIVEVYIDPTLDPPKGNARQSYSGRHVYVQDKMLALNKNAIELLAKAAGINTKVARTRPDPEGAIEYTAYATLRRPDGTVEEWEASREKMIDVEREKVKATCLNKDTGQLDQTYFLKRWTTERDFLPAKVESMALLRVISNALQLKRGGYTHEELLKPFLVIAWSLTPSDPAVRREIALHAAGVLTGRIPARREIEEPEPDLALPAPSVETPEPNEATHEVVDTVPATAAPVSQEPDPNEPVAGEIPANVAAAGDTIFPEGFRAAGKKISETRREYLDHVAFEMNFQPPQEPVVKACRVWVGWLQQQEAGS